MCLGSEKNFPLGGMYYNTSSKVIWAPLSYPVYVCRYSKDESLTTVKQLATFDYVLTAKDPASLEEVFEYVADFHAFSGIQIAGYRIAFQTRKLISLMRNRKVAFGQA